MMVTRFDLLSEGANAARMKTVGLVTEYNPFHNGHKYHIEEAKRITGADYAIAVMSGSFVQRGTPAVIDKYSRARMALQNGIDLVLELPVCYATGSAEYFAHGAVSLLDKLGIVDSICFGSECGDIRLLQEAASFLSDTPADFDHRLQAFLRDGLTYPAARLKALQNTLKEDHFSDSQKLSEVLTEPNNILGIEYMKALMSLHSTIIPVTIRRKAAHYHDSSLSGRNSYMHTGLKAADIVARSKSAYMAEASQDEPIINSATAIRKSITGNEDRLTDDLENIRSSIPDSVYDILTECYQKTFPINEEDFSQIIRYKLMSESTLLLSAYMDISSDLADRLKKYSGDCCSIAELTQRIKSRNMTLTRISRALIHLLLNIRSEAVEEYSSNGYAQYARILGIRKESSHLLRCIEKAGKIPLITKVAKASEQLDSLGMRMLSEDIFAAHLYNQAVYDKFGIILPNEYKHGICIV